MPSDVQFFDLLRGHGDPRFVLFGVEKRLDSESGPGAGAADQVDDRLVADQGLPLPI